MAKDKEVKFVEDEMNTIKGLQQTYATVQNTLGQLSVSRIRLEQEVSNLDDAENKLRSDFENTQKREREFVESINKKYGDGSLDINTGVFTPTPPSEETPKTL